MLWIILGILTSYLLGSIPTAYIFGRAVKGIDIRKFGSGNVGATNALRVLGKGPGAMVLLLDISKGFLAATLLADFLAHKVIFIPEETLPIILGVSCICGHTWTVFLGFKGGKGVATTLGVLLGLSVKVAGLNLVLGLALLTWLAVFILSRIVSLASVFTCIVFPFYMLLFKQPKVILYTSVILSVFIILRHKANLKRLLQNKEAKISFRKSA